MRLTRPGSLAIFPGLACLLLAAGCKTPPISNARRGPNPSAAAASITNRAAGSGGVTPETGAAGNAQAAYDQRGADSPIVRLAAQRLDPRPQPAQVTLRVGDAGSVPSSALESNFELSSEH